MITNKTLVKNNRCKHKEKRRREKRNNQIKNKEAQIYSISIWIEIHPNRGLVCYLILINIIYLSKITKIKNNKEMHKANQLWAVTKVYPVNKILNHQK